MCHSEGMERPKNLAEGVIADNRQFELGNVGMLDCLNERRREEEPGTGQRDVFDAELVAES